MRMGDARGKEVFFRDYGFTAARVRTGFEAMTTPERALELSER
jgi:hypothetical protein